MIIYNHFSINKTFYPFGKNSLQNTQICTSFIQEFTVLKNYLILSVLMISTLVAKSQSQVSVDAFYLQGFQGRTLHLWGEAIENYKSPGFAAHLNYSYSFQKPKLDVQLGAGFQQFYFSGASGNETFEGQTSRVDILLKTMCRITPKWKTGVGFNIENNLQFDDFRAKATDLWRYSFLVDLSYNLTERFALTMRYYTVLSPNVDAFLVSNPAHKIGLGVNYKIWGK